MTTVFSTLYSDCNQSQSSQWIAMQLHACTHRSCHSVRAKRPVPSFQGVRYPFLHPYIHNWSQYIVDINCSCMLHAGWCNLSVCCISLIESLFRTARSWAPFWTEVFSLTDFPTYAYRYRMYFLVHLNCDAPDLDAQLCAHRNVSSVKSCHARLQRLLMGHPHFRWLVMPLRHVECFFFRPILITKHVMPGQMHLSLIPASTRVVVDLLTAGSTENSELFTCLVSPPVPACAKSLSTHHVFK